MVKTYYDPQWFIDDCKKLTKKLPNDFDALLGVVRGGLCLTHMLSQSLDIRCIKTITLVSYDDAVQLDHVEVTNIPDLSGHKKILICEDIIDSGKSMQVLMPLLTELYPEIIFEVVALFYKKSASFTPKYYQNEAQNWIEFFWER